MHPPASRPLLVLFTVAILLAAGCATPQAKLARFAASHGWEEAVVRGQPFRHLVWRNQQPLSPRGLHVYLEGDGRPFDQPTVVAADPTSRRGLMLHLMALDPAAAIYVGRPCYGGLHTDSGCDPGLWTDRRFSPEVIDSFAVVIDAEAARRGAAAVQLFGHSGGGAIAVLLTQHLRSVGAIVTLAGNLDLAAWTQLHGFTPLHGSLDPARVVLDPALAAHTDHYVGDRDDVVPASLVLPAAARIGGEVHSLRGFTHDCCWESLWPAILLTH